MEISLEKILGNLKGFGRMQLFEVSCIQANLDKYRDFIYPPFHMQISVGKYIFATKSNNVKDK